MKHIGLCNRHEMCQNDGTPITEFIFEGEVEEPMDFIGHFHTAKDYFQERFSKGKWLVGHVNRYTLYVTGLTPCLTATLLAAKATGISTLKLMHYDRETEQYLEQDMSGLLTTKL